MKRIISILLAVLMLCVCACAAADEVPQPEGGMKFESDWAAADALVQIFYEEEGYRISLEMMKDDGGTVWEYACYYYEETDSLVSVSSSRMDYTLAPDTGDKVFGESAYDDLDDESTATVFTIEDGCLIWKDGREDAGAGLKFQNIGRFNGSWKSEEAEVRVDFMWNGLSPDSYYYTVYITRGKTDGDTYALFLMNGDYDPATGKLTASGTCTVFTRNAAGEYDTEDDGESYDAVFSRMENGDLLFETENGIELEYDLMGDLG